MPLIKQSSFVSSFDRYRRNMVQVYPEIAIVGRSNVGKSSLINMLTGNSKLARVSSEPGKTRLINYFLIEQRCYLVDLPGYGFAKASKSEQKKWGDMIEGYLKGSDELMLVLLLVDIRHRPTADDKMMAEWLRNFGVPFCVVATKADKLSRAQQNKNLMDIAFDLKLDMVKNIIVTSSEKKTGGEKIVDVINEVCEAYAAEETPETEEE